MAYRFKLKENVSKSFRRIALEQIDIALGHLQGDNVGPSGIHGSRKAMKRLRALVEAFAPLIGVKAAKSHNNAARDIGRMLSAWRDADVSAETINKLEAHYGTEGATALRGLRQHLMDKGRARLGAVPAEILLEARDRLLSERQRFVATELETRQFKAVIDGIEDSYRRGRAAIKTAYRKPTDENFHDLRKAVQTHWRQMALLTRAWPDEFEARVAAARELSQYLGDDHDLALLAQSTAQLGDRDRQMAGELCACRQGELRQLVDSRVRRLFAEKPKAFSRRMSLYWELGRNIKAHAKIAKRRPSSVASPEVPLPLAADGSPPRVAAKAPASPPSLRSV